MPRPIKDGFLYWSKDTGFYNNDKVRLLRSEFGAKGMYMLDFLLCELFGNKGYFIKWDKNKCFLVSDGAGCGCSPEFISEFVNGCVRQSFFDKGLFDKFGILTSAGIQRQYVRMFGSRDEIKIIREFWLLNEYDKEDVPTKVLDKIVFKNVSGTENSKKTQKNGVSCTENPLNKIKQNKSNSMEEKIAKRFCPPTLAQVKEYCNERNNNVDAGHFVDYYTSNGWKVGKNKMKDWKAAVRSWEHNDYSQNKSEKKQTRCSYDIAEIKELLE